MQELRILHYKADNYKKYLISVFTEVTKMEATLGTLVHLSHS